MKDLTQEYDYERLVEEEIEQFKSVEPSDELTVIDDHRHDAWAYYWEWVAARLGQTPYADIAAYLLKQRPTDEPVRILGLASGYCGHELTLARRLGDDCRITCTDLNPALFEQAQQIARDEGLNVDFVTMDMNFPDFEPGAYDMICSYAAIHHAINIEHLMTSMIEALAPHGVLHLVEVIGQNRKLIWDENERFANHLLALLPDDLIRGERVIAPDGEGMEGIRQEEIVPNLRRYFSTEFELLFGAFMRYICTGRDLGRHLDPGNPEAKRHLDMLIDMDEATVRNGVLRPLEMWGIYRPIR